MTTANTVSPTLREPQLLGQTVVVIGGSAGTGLETARLARAVPDLAETRAAVELIIRDGHRASAVIQRIRALSKKTDPQTAWLDIDDIIRGTRRPIVGDPARRSRRVLGRILGRGRVSRRREPFASPTHPKCVGMACRSHYSNDEGESRWRR